MPYYEPPHSLHGHCFARLTILNSKNSVNQKLFIRTSRTWRPSVIMSSRTEHATGLAAADPTAAADPLPTLGVRLVQSSPWPAYTDPIYPLGKTTVTALMALQECTDDR